MTQEYGNELARAQAQHLAKTENPFLAERLEDEARNTIINPWLGAGNVTRQGKIHARDLGLAHLLRTAAFRQRVQADAERDELQRMVADADKRAAELRQRAAARR